MGYFCPECGTSVPEKRVAIGYVLCLDCGEAQARTARLSWTVVPMHKSNYILASNRETVKQLNPKRTG